MIVVNQFAVNLFGVFLTGPTVLVSTCYLQKMLPFFGSMFICSMFKPTAHLSSRSFPSLNMPPKTGPTFLTYPPYHIRASIPLTSKPQAHLSTHV